MKVSVYLDRTILDILKCYGELNDIVDKILKHWDTGDIDILNKPSVGPRDKSVRKVVDIYNQSYIEAMSSYGATSPVISLRRILYWFIEEDMPSLLGWKTVKKYVNSDKQKYDKYICQAIDSLQRALTVFTNNEDTINNIITTLEGLCYDKFNKTTEHS